MSSSGRYSQASWFYPDTETTHQDLPGRAIFTYVATGWTVLDTAWSAFFLADRVKGVS